MSISRSGYYKWLKTKDILNRYEINRKDLEPLIRDIHKRKPSYGYHRINYLIRKEKRELALLDKQEKLLEKQKAGKKRMKAIGSVEVPQEAFLSVLSMDEE